MTAVLNTICELPNTHSLTEVEIHYVHRLRNFRLLFGHPLRIENKEFSYQNVTRKIAYFEPGAILGLDLWECNQYGTARWDVYVVQAAFPGEETTMVPQVKPAVKILLEAHGQQKAKAALQALREIEARADPATLSPARFLLTDFRLKGSSQKQKF